jgi:phosphoenolpyruvate phosphomutase
MYQQKVTLERITPEPEHQGQRADGRWIGMMRVAGEGVGQLQSALGTLQQREDFNSLAIPDLLNQLVEDGHAPQVQYINGHWMDINNLDDLERAGTFENIQND